MIRKPGHLKNQEMEELKCKYGRINRSLNLSFWTNSVLNKKVHLSDPLFQAPETTDETKTLTKQFS
jgi:hypothetical protein